eukprot:scaffold3225_cov72-Skeletonema_dohrnii-CCMP3373.AAC.2
MRDFFFDSISFSKDELYVCVIIIIIMMNNPSKVKIISEQAFSVHHHLASVEMYDGVEETSLAGRHGSKKGDGFSFKALTCVGVESVRSWEKRSYNWISSTLF